MSPETTRPLVPVAVHVFLTRGGDVLLLRRANTGYEDGSYSVPAGHLEPRETVADAAARELAEETGIRIAPAAFEVVGVMHRLAEHERVDFFVSSQGWAGEPANCEPEKCDELRWFPLVALPANVIPYVRRALENWGDGRWFDSFGFAGGVPIHERAVHDAAR